MLWICLACTTAYSAEAPCCPHCGGTEYRLSTDPVDGEGVHEVPVPEPLGGSDG